MSNWKSNEKQMFSLIKDSVPALSDIKWAEGGYSRYDAYSQFSIVELKYRKGPQYADTLIEYSKYQALRELNNGRLCVYAVQSAGNIYLFNLNRLHKEQYDYKWENRDCNATSEFHNQSQNRKKKSKQVGYISWDQADIILNVSTKELTRRPFEEA